ncbi:MAG: GtrA family protein [Ktedonobacterales bacterium]
MSQLLESEPANGTETSLGRGSTQPVMVVRPAAPPRSYHPTRIPLVNRSLEVVDRVSNGKAGFFQRLVSYLIIGGCAAIVNLAVFRLLYYIIPWPAASVTALGFLSVRWLWAQAWAYEISILANFVPNDYFTFRHLSGHSRTWLTRCGRFHLTSVGGIIVTTVISAALLYGLRMDAFIAQAIALILATAFNFSMHHIFTYRHVAHA